MSDPPQDNRDSIPLLLQRSTQRTARFKPPPRTERPPGTTRAAFSVAARTRLGGAGMLVAAMLAIVAIFADLLASEYPILCSAHGHVYVLPAITHPAALSPHDTSWAIGPLVMHGPTRIESRPLLSPGVEGHPFGTDREGHDVFAKVIHATRSYLVFAFAAVSASIVLGALFGGLGGLLGGVTDAITSRAIETISAFPPLVFVIGVQAAVPRASLTTLFVAIAVTRWPEIARLVRGEVMLRSTRDFVLAARALGASPFRILRKHIAPSVRGSLIVAAAASISTVVLIEASLDFLRVGAPASSASWGETMSQFRDAPSAWWLLAFPGLLLVATVIGLNLAGESFREALDPRAR